MHTPAHLDTPNNPVTRTTPMKAICFALLLVYPLSAAGFISAQNSRATPSPDRTRLLVMLPTGNLSDQTPTATLPDGRTVSLRATFAKSGVYAYLKERASTRPSEPR
jgi:hypothetical protein